MKHDRFESLAGAIALGEATPVERAAFDAHALDCAACRDDAAGAPLPLDLLAEAREGERWRPTLDHAILTRIRDRQTRRSRFTVAAIGWAAGLSMAINLVVATGLAGSFAHSFAPPREVAPPSIVDAGIRLPAQTFATSPLRPPARIAYVPSRTAHRPRVRSFRAALRVHVRPPAAAAPVPAAALAAEGVVPDVFADLLAPGDARSGRKVAIEPTLLHDRELHP